MKWQQFQAPENQEQYLKVDLSKLGNCGNRQFAGNNPLLLWGSSPEQDLKYAKIDSEMINLFRNESQNELT